jgi:hypothetical protein
VKYLNIEQFIELPLGKKRQIRAARIRNARKAEKYCKSFDNKWGIEYWKYVVENLKNDKLARHE